MRHVHSVPLTARRLPVVVLALLLAAVAGCEDELNNPQVFTCDEVLEITIEEVPVTIEYRVAADGDAVVHSVTYTTPDGDVTTTTLDHDAPNDIVFDEAVEFATPGEAILRAQGEVATGGQIGIAYTFVFEDGSRLDSFPSVCGA